MPSASWTTSATSSTTCVVTRNAARVPTASARSSLPSACPPASSTRALQTGPDFHALARQVRSRKFGAEPPAAWKERARQARFLQYRGFAGDHIKAAMGADALDLADDPL